MNCKFWLKSLSGLIVGLSLETIIKSTGVDIRTIWIPSAIVGAAFFIIWMKGE